MLVNVINDVFLFNMCVAFGNFEFSVMKTDNELNNYRKIMYFYTTLSI